MSGKFGTWEEIFLGWGEGMSQFLASGENLYPPSKGNLSVGATLIHLSTHTFCQHATKMTILCTTLIFF